MQRRRKDRQATGKGRRPPLARCASRHGHRGTPSQRVFAMAGAQMLMVLMAIARSASATPGGELLQLPGAAGCVTETGAFPCADGNALDGARSVAVSPDGKNVYVVSGRILTPSSNALAIFDRDPITGQAVQKAGTAGCISDNGTGGTCVDGEALEFAEAVAVSPDGGQVYVASLGGLAIFDRDAMTGALTQKAGTAGCLTVDGSAGACVTAPMLFFVQSLALSPDGRQLYVTTVDRVVILDRDTTTGALNQKAGTAACVSDDGSGGVCADGTALAEPAFV
ncbi:MAG TPA: hypothetical protein VNO54_14065, partial [Streptosporangiaceae bacterium]|nr:hypothetical protein [Streptosporangiaceae bacterium]